MVRLWSHYSIRQHEALFELDRQLGLGSVPRNRWIFPARLHITQHQPAELGGSLFTGEVAAHPHRLADLRVKALDRIGGVEDFAQVKREGEERYHLLPVAPPALGNRWIFLPPGAAVKILQPLARRRGRLGLVDRFERCRHRPPFLPRGKVHRVTDEMHDAGLDHGLGKHRGYRLGKTFEPVDHGNQDVLGAAVAQFGHHPRPELRAFGLLDPQSEISLWPEQRTPSARYTARLLTIPSLRIFTRIASKNTMA